MSKTALFTQSGEPIRLADMVGRGGEGAVYEIAGHSEGGLAVKLYSSGAADRADKIQFMVRQGLFQKAPLAAFPLEVVLTREGRFAGFLMKLVREHKPLFELVAPGARKRHFPNADYRFLVRASANLARCVAAVHQQGCVIGDINHAGVLVSQNATMTLIDADSFQVSNGTHRYFCRVGVPEYTPPELQGQHLGNVIRTVDHDAFGLAVSIFQLLFMGKHPFAGVPLHGELPIHQAIKERKFPYRPNGCRGFSPPPSAPSLSQFPSLLQAAFVRAFDGSAARRPTAVEWIEILNETERGLRTCATSPRHYYPAEAATCLWCKMEDTQGVALFPAPGVFVTSQTIPDPGVANFRLEIVWSAICAVPPPSGSALPTMTAPVPKPSAEAATARQQGHWKRVGSALLLFLMAAGLAAYPQAWFFWIGGGLWSFASFKKPGMYSPQFQRRAEEFDRRWQRAIDEWRQRPLIQFNAILDELRDAKTQFESLGHREAAEIARINQGRNNSALDTFLRTKFLGQYSIMGVGPGRLATLRRHGIETASDVTSAKLARIPGFGPTLAAPILAWRKRLEQQFQPSQSLTPEDIRRIQVIKSQFAGEAAKLRTQLANGPARLRQIASGAASGAPIDAALRRLHLQRLQAHVDAKHLGFDIRPNQPTPSVTRVTPTPAQHVPRPTAYRTPTTGFQTTPNCPRCGSSMVRRMARRGRNRGNPFWGCSQYFTGKCKGTRPI